MAKKPAPSVVVSAASEKGSPDAGTAGELAGVHPSVSEGEVREGMFPPDFSWPDCLSTDKALCGELINSIRVSDASYPDLADFVGKDTYERVARATVRVGFLPFGVSFPFIFGFLTLISFQSLMHTNEMVAEYEIKLAEARREAEEAKKEAEAARKEAEEVRKAADKKAVEMRAYNKKIDDQRLEEAATFKGEIDRLTAQMGRLQDRLRYLQAVEEPSGLVTQIRGTLGVVDALKEKGVVIPRRMTDIMEKDLKEFEAQVKAIPEVKLDPEDL